jgi:hypothetical protein
MGNPANNDHPDMASTPPVCACQWGERCINGACQPVKTLSIYLGVNTSDPATGTHLVSGQAFGYSYHYIGGSTAPSGTQLATDGPCVATQYIVSNTTSQAAWMVDDGAAGNIIITGGNPAQIVLSPTISAAGLPIYQDASLPTTQGSIFVPGGRFTISSTGGSDFPAFTAQLDQPPELGVAMNSVTRGSPLTVSWTGGSSVPVSISLVVFAADNQSETTIQCINVPDTGAYTVSAKLTQMLPSGSSAWLSVYHSVTQHLEPMGKAVAIELTASSSGARGVAYQP